MRHIPFLSIAGRTGVSLRVLRQFGSLLLPLPAVVLTALHLHAQVPTAYTPKELLATDPRVFTDWLETHRPRSVSASQKARILEVLPAEGEITNLDDAGRQKLAAVKQLLQATDRESGYEVKVIDVSYSADRRIRAIRHPDFEVSAHAARYRRAPGAGRPRDRTRVLHYRLRERLQDPKPSSSQGSRTALRRHCDRDGPPAGNESCPASECDR